MSDSDDVLERWAKAKVGMGIDLVMNPQLVNAGNAGDALAAEVEQERALTLRWKDAHVDLAAEVERLREENAGLRKSLHRALGLMEEARGRQR
jgi:hypothetical protein